MRWWRRHFGDDSATIASASTPPQSANTGQSGSAPVADAATTSAATVSARAGKKFYNDDRDVGSSGASYGLSGGFGVRVPVAGRSMRFDYSYTSLGALQNTQVFSFEFGR